MQAAREIREKQLIRVLDSFGADQGEALKQVWDTSGRWTRYVESADTVLEALERAIPRFSNLEMLLRERDEKD